MVHDERMTSPPRAAHRGRFTAAAVVAAVVLAVAGSAVGTAYDRSGTAMFADTLSFAFAIAVVAVVGAIVTLAVPGNRVGWLMLTAAAVLGIGTAFTEAGIHGAVTVPGSVPGGAYLAALGPGLQAAGTLIAVVGVPVVFSRRPPARPAVALAGLVCRRRGMLFLFLGSVLSPTYSNENRLAHWHSPLGLPVRDGNVAGYAQLPPGFCSRWAPPPEPSPGSSPDGGAGARWSGSSCCCWPWPPGRPRWYCSP